MLRKVFIGFDYIRPSSVLSTVFVIIYEHMRVRVAAEKWENLFVMYCI